MSDDGKYTPPLFNKEADFVSGVELAEIRRTLEDARRSASDSFRLYITINVIIFLFIITGSTAIFYIESISKLETSRIYALLFSVLMTSLALFVNFIAYAETRIISQRSRALQIAMIDFARHNSKFSIVDYEWKILGDFSIKNHGSLYIKLYGQAFAFFPILDAFATIPSLFTAGFK